MPRRGRFWPAIRERAWEIAYQLWAEDFHRSHEENPTLPTRRELREEGYWYLGKVLALREWNEAHRGLREDEPPSYEEWLRLQERENPDLQRGTYSPDPEGC